MMKLSSMLCTSLVALAALALTAEGASAAPQFSVNTSRFDPYKLKANDPNGEKDCNSKGGKVFTDNEGVKTCKDVQDNAVADTGRTAKPNSDEKAGVTAHTDGSRGVWKAPAGIDCKTAKGTGDRTQQGRVQLDADQNEASMACDKSMGKTAKGSAASGAAASRTDTQGIPDAAQSPGASEWKYIPVRRLGLKLEKALYSDTKWVVFEPNDEPLWAQVRLKVGDYMMSLYRQGEFQGKTPKDAFFVKCDRSTMTQNDLDNGRLTILVGFAPLKPAEFVILKIVQHTRVGK